MSLVKGDHLQGVGASVAREFDDTVQCRSLFYHGNLNAGGALLEIGERVIDHTVVAGSDTTAAAAIKDGEMLISVTARILTTVALTTGTTISIGVSGATTRFGTGLALTAGTTTTSANFLSHSPLFSASDLGIIITPSAGTIDSGVIRLVVKYLKVGAPAK